MKKLLLVVGCVALGYVAYIRISGLTEAGIQDFVNASLKSNLDRDAKNYCAIYAEHAQITVVTISQTEHEQKIYTKDEYCQELKKGYVTYNATNASVNTFLTVQSLEIAPDRKSADLAGEYSEEVTIHGQTMRGVSQQTVRIELIGLKPKITRVMAEWRGR